MTLSGRSRALVAAGALIMLVGFVAPLWHIELLAPQYPEGLGLRIWVSQIRGAQPGDLQSINGLNHYIGMRKIEPDAIAELRLMPWILGGLILSGLAVAALGRRRISGAWLAAAMAVALVGLVDFWKWGYDYGHQLDPQAIIKVPGMSYQPPLLGSKQLLNFQATSWPGLGGWAILAGLLLAAVGWWLSRPVVASVAAQAQPTRMPRADVPAACSR